MTYLLNTEAMRVVNRNERGTVTYRKRYKRGDEVDTSKMESEYVEALVAKGTLVQSESDVAEPADAGDTPPTSPPFGAATAPSVPGEDGPDADEMEGTEQDTGEEEKPEGFEEATGEGDDEAEHDVDEYDAMDYADLQQVAKSRDLNAGGSAADLRARLRDDDES